MPDSPIDHTSGALNQNNAGQGYAADNNFSGDAFRASAGIGENPDTNLDPTRDMYSGTTSVGAVNENADTAVLGGASTPGVRGGFDDGSTGGGRQTTGVTSPGEGAPEKAADALAGDDIQAETGGPVLNDPANNTSVNVARNAGSGTEGSVHGVIGDVTNSSNGIADAKVDNMTDESTDSRGIVEKIADAFTGNRTDDTTR